MIKLDRIKLLEISNLGTIEGIKNIKTFVGEGYIYPKVSFFAIDEGIFSPENSHFVITDCIISINERALIIENNKRKVEFLLEGEDYRALHLGNKYGYRTLDDLNYVEFSISDYYLEVYFSNKKRA